jgi:adenylyltransferase/sulfurtransferase
VVDILERYARQFAFNPIGKEGQQRLLQSKVTVVGMGGLGTVIANNLCRAGIGHIRIIDKDYVEKSNLHRQILYNEDDAALRLPKTTAAFNRLSKVNSEITIEPIAADVNATNIEELLNNSDLVLDATDNMDTRILINETCHEKSVPWIYGGVLGSRGMTLNILTGGPCLLCLIGDSVMDSSYNCKTVGVLNSAVNIIASVQSTEAIKILLCSDAVRKDLLIIDVWENSFDNVELNKNKNCPVCFHREHGSCPR